jgi:hypothetical protein
MSDKTNSNENYIQKKPYIFTLNFFRELKGENRFVNLQINNNNDNTHESCINNNNSSNNINNK